MSSDGWFSSVHMTNKHNVDVFLIILCSLWSGYCFRFGKWSGTWWGLVYWLLLYLQLFLFNTSYCFMTFISLNSHVSTRWWILYFFLVAWWRSGLFRGSLGYGCVVVGGYNRLALLYRYCWWFSVGCYCWCCLGLVCCYVLPWLNLISSS